MPRALIVEILGNAKQFGAELDRAAGKTRRLGATAGVAGLAIAGGLAVGLDKSVKAAVQAQTTTARMDQAFRSSGVSAEAYAGKIDKAETSGRRLGFTNEDQRQSLGSLVVATHSGKQAISDLGTAEDIARFKHVDLTQATKMLTMAQTGSQRALKQLGLTIPPVTTAQDALKAKYMLTTAAIRSHYQSLGTLTTAQKLQEMNALDNAKASEKDALATAKVSDTQKTAANITEVLNQKLKGQAEQYSKTAQGGVARMHAETQALEENLGSALLPALGFVVNKLADLTGFMTKHTTTTKILVAALAVLAGTLLTVSAATKVMAAGQAIATAASKIFMIQTEETDAALAANPIGIVVVALVGLGIAFTLAWKKSETFRDIVKGSWDVIKGTTIAFIDFFTQKVPAAFELVKGKITGALSGAKEWVAGHWPEIATLISGPFAPLVALATNAFGIRDKLEGAFDKMKDKASALVGDITGFFSDLPGKIGNAIAGGASALYHDFLHLFSKLPGWARDALGIASPSKVFTEIGGHIVSGLIKGMESKAGDLRAAAERILGHAVDWATGKVEGVGKAIWSAVGGAFGSGEGPGHLVKQVVNALRFARGHGWGGVVTSGYRTYAQQAVLYERYLHGGPIAAKPGTSSHEFGQAVDVTQIAEFARAMRMAPPGSRLYSRVPGDPVHFSVTGYASGGLIGGGAGQAVPIMAHAGEMVLNKNQQNKLGGTSFLAGVLGFAKGGIGGKRPAMGRPTATSGQPLAVTVNVGPVHGSADPAFAKMLSDQIAMLLRGGRAPQLQQAVHAI